MDRSDEPPDGVENGLIFLRWFSVSNNDVVLKISTKSTATANRNVLVFLPRSTPAPKGKIIMTIVESAPTKE